MSAKRGYSGQVREDNGGKEAKTGELSREDKELVAAARAVREKSYSPYSGYAVGSAFRTRSGKVFVGTNVENASYSLTNCAERSAIFSAVSQGERDFVACAVATEHGWTPCGACRQVMAEFSPNLRIIIADAHVVTGMFTLGELLPQSFDSTKLEHKGTK